MAASVEHQFEKRFILGEEHVRRIHDVLQNRLSKLNTPVSHYYKVHRGDSFFYETKSVEDVISEDYEDWRAINRLDIIASQDGVIDFQLSFSANHSLLKINGSDRDTVFLLFSDIKEYLSSEVFRGRRLDARATRHLFIVLTVMAMVICLYLMSRADYVSPKLLEETIGTADVAKKLNYLIERNNARRVGMPMLGLSVPLLLILLYALVPDNLFQSNVFLFGKRITTFERRRRIKANIFWVIVVGVVVSALGSFIVKLL